MIKRLRNKKNASVFIECDMIKIPQWGINIDYTSDHCMPFLFGKDKNDKEFVMVGKKGEAHNELIWNNRKALSKISSLDRHEYLLGRIWFVYSYYDDAPIGLVTFWEGECNYNYTNAATIKTMIGLLKENRININEFEIPIEVEDGGYSISVNEYISLNLSRTSDIPSAYERQERKKKSMSSSSDRWKAWDINNNGTGYLGYHLMTRVEENNKKNNISKMKKDVRILDENKLAQLVYECTMEYINKTPDLKKKLQERKEKSKKVVKESKSKQQGITYEMLFEMVKGTVKRLLK